MNFFQRFWVLRVRDPLWNQLRQGTSHAALATGCAVGGVLGVIPILGSATALCGLAGVVFRLNHVALQVANYAVSPLQWLLFPVFVRAGEAVFGLKPVPLNPLTFTQEFLNHPILFLKVYGASGLGGLVVWAALGIPVGWVGRGALKRLFVWTQRP